MAKAKGKEKPAASTVPAEVEETTSDDNAEPTPSEPVKMEEEEDVDAGPNKLKEAEKSVETEKMEEEEVKVDGTVEAATPTITPGGEKMDEGDTIEEVKADENASNSKRKRQMNRKKKASDAGASASNAADKPEASDPENKGPKKTEGMGLIFMCSSKTKNDCFQYKVFGLPESKKDLVGKIYKGMRLFLFDIDLKVMYGIYKAASPGGYNIEPKAFKSAFPSQVRFTVLDECKPLPEEKFKAAIIANYYDRNKFNVQLSQEQVKDLCKLFMSENKTPKRKRLSGAGKAPNLSGRDQIRKPPRAVQREEDSYYPRGLSYTRESYSSVLPPPFQQPPAAFSYERSAIDPYFRPRERILDADMRPREPVEYRDPYNLYGEPASYRDPYCEAGYPPSEYYPYPPSGLYIHPSNAPRYRYGNRII